MDYALGRSALGFIDIEVFLRIGSIKGMITDSSVSSDLITIHSPIEIVWEVLTDFPNYFLWNSFCPKIDGALELGSAVTMQVDLGHGLQKNVEYITKIEPPNTLVWSMENKPGDPVRADRYQNLIYLDEKRCTYQTEDYFSGEAVTSMIEGMGEQIQLGFNKCALGLKRRSEEIFFEMEEARSLDEGR